MVYCYFKESSVDTNLLSFTQTFNKYWLKSVRFSSVTIINTIIKTHFGDLIPFLFDIQKVPCFVDVLIDMSLNSKNFYSAVNLIYKNNFINHSISCRSKMLNLPWSIETGNGIFWTAWESVFRLLTKPTDEASFYLTDNYLSCLHVNCVPKA